MSPGSHHELQIAERQLDVLHADGVRDHLVEVEGLLRLERPPGEGVVQYDGGLCRNDGPHRQRVARSPHLPAARIEQADVRARQENTIGLDLGLNDESRALNSSPGCWI